MTLRKDICSSTNSKEVPWFVSWTWTLERLCIRTWMIRVPITHSWLHDGKLNDCVKAVVAEKLEFDFTNFDDFILNECWKKKDFFMGTCSSDDIEVIYGKALKEWVKIGDGDPGVGVTCFVRVPLSRCWRVCHSSLRCWILSYDWISYLGLLVWIPCTEKCANLCQGYRLNSKNCFAGVEDGVVQQCSGRTWHRWGDWFHPWCALPGRHSSSTLFWRNFFLFTFRKQDNYSCVSGVHELFCEHVGFYSTNSKLGINCFILLFSAPRAGDIWRRYLNRRAWRILQDYGW